MQKVLFVFLAVTTALIFSRPAGALTVTPLDDNIVSVESVVSAESRDAAMTKARQEAVLACAGRILLEDVLIRADDLLTKYLQNYAGEFVIGVEVLKDEFSGGKTQLATRVFINYKKLKDDMKEKKFIYDPSFRPMVVTFIEETLNGDAIEQAPARQIFSSTLESKGFKIYDGQIETPPIETNLMDDDFLIQSAIVAAERRNIEIIFTGLAETQLREEKKVYYENYYFYDCSMRMQMIRVDTGEVIKEVESEGSASAMDQGEAISVAIERASLKIAEGFHSAYREFWPSVVQGNSDYKILLTGTDDELINIVSQHLSGVGRNTSISVRKKFDRSAMMTISTELSRDELIEILESCPYPVLSIVEDNGKDKFEIQVSG